MFRHDAQFGFFGGIIDSGESVLDGLNREMSEEIDLDLKRFKVTENEGTRMILTGFKTLTEITISLCEN